MSNANKVEWLDGTKPTQIEARYNAYLSWDLDHEKIDWDDIEDFDVCRGQLYIKLKNGEEKYIDSWSDDNVDYKHGLKEVLILDEGGYKVEGLNE